MPLRRHAPQGVVGRTHRLQSHSLDDGGSGSLGGGSRAVALLQPSSRVTSGVASAQFTAPPPRPVLEAPPNPSRQSPTAQTTQGPTLRAPSHSPIPKRLRQTPRFQGRRAPNTRQNRCEILVALDRNVRAPFRLPLRRVALHRRLPTC